MSEPFYDEYTGTVTCKVTFSRMAVTKTTTDSGIATYTFSLSNKVKYDQYATNILGMPFSAADVPYDERRQEAVVLFKDRTRLRLTVNFVKNHFETKLSLAQFNTMKSRPVIGVRLLKSKWNYDVSEADGELVQRDLQSLSKSMNVTEIRKKQEAIEDADRKEAILREEAEQKKKEEMMREDDRRRARVLEAEAQRRKGGPAVYVPVKVMEEEEDPICHNPDVSAEFPGDVMQYIAKSMQYPDVAKENGTQGRVIVQFVVNVDGSTVNLQVVKSVDPYLDKEALRIVQSMPKWKPGKKGGKAVSVRYTVPVMFRLH